MPARRGLVPLTRRLCRLLSVAPLLVLTGTPWEPEAAEVHWAPPFVAQVAKDATGLRSGPSRKSHRIAELGAGTRVEVRACIPDCLAVEGWAELEAGGFLPLGGLAPPAEELLFPGDGRGGALATSLAVGDALPSWGVIRRGGATIRRAPDDDAAVVSRAKPGVTLAFLRDPPLEATGWLRHRDGGFVRAEDVHLFEPTALRGELEPSGPLAFLWRAAPLTLDGDGAGEGPAPVVILPPYSRLRVEGLEGDRVRVEGGSLPRDAVRIAMARPRPPSIPGDAKWVHVDLEENVLTAYEGDRWVYATLVSAGAPLPTRDSDEGLFRVWSKRRFARMYRPGEYDVEAVPDVLFYNRGEALHGSFWHGSFGEAVSHGCINLSLEDAAWVFAWAPPELPPGWTWRDPRPEDASLWVQVEYAVPFGDALGTGVGGSADGPMGVHGP